MRQVGSIYPKTLFLTNCCFIILLFTKALNRKAQGKKAFEGAFTEPNISLQKLIYLSFFQSEETGKKEEGRDLPEHRSRMELKFSCFDLPLG